MLESNGSYVWPMLRSLIASGVLAACGGEPATRTETSPGAWSRPTAAAAATAPAMPAANTATPSANLPATPESDTSSNAPLAPLPSGEAQRLALCERAKTEPRTDRVVDAFCAAVPAPISSLVELQAALGLAFREEADQAAAAGQAAGPEQTEEQAEGNPGFALAGHTASLSARGATAINPRAIVFTNLTSERSMVAMGFTRGEQAVELIARDRDTDGLNFYLVAYRQPCNGDNACTPGDTLTPNTESGWTQASVYAGQDLENTVLDCTTCHVVENDAGESRAILRFQELQNPWTHWFRDNSFGGIALIDDYRAAHGEDEVYAGIPGDRIQDSEPALLQVFVTREGFGNQPNEFRTAAIEVQVYGSAPNQPVDNSAPGTSDTWKATYTNFVEGNAIPVPYHDVKVTDASKLTQMTSAYNEFRAGTLPANRLPDIRETMRDDRLFEMAGIHIDPELKGQALVTAACTQCHNSRLNQQITRSRFNADLNQFSDMTGGVLTGANRDAQLRLAITRLHLANADVNKMPPERLRSLSAEQIGELESYFCSQMQTPDEGCRTRLTY